MQSRNQSNGCCATPRQPFNCQMRRQHLRCCQPSRSAKSVPHTQSATYRCIVSLVSYRFLPPFLLYFFYFFVRLMRRLVGSTFTRRSISIPTSNSPFPIRFRLGRTESSVRLANKSATETRLWCVSSEKRNKSIENLFINFPITSPAPLPAFCQKYLLSFCYTIYKYFQWGIAASEGA